MKTEKPKQYTVVIWHKHTGKVERIKLAASRITVKISMQKLLEPGSNGKIVVNAEDLELGVDNYGNRRIVDVKHKLQQEALQDPKFAKRARKDGFSTANNTMHQLELTTGALVSLIDEKIVAGLKENAVFIKAAQMQLQSAKDSLDFFNRAKKKFKKNKDLIRYKGYVK